MPDSGAAPRGFGALGTVRNTISVLREVSITELREEAEREPTVLVIAPDEATARDLAGELVGPDAHRQPKVSSLFARVEMLESYDAVVVFDPNGMGRAEELKRQARSDGPSRIFSVKGSSPTDSGALESVRNAVEQWVDRGPER